LKSSEHFTCFPTKKPDGEKRALPEKKRRAIAPGGP